MSQPNSGWMLVTTAAILPPKLPLRLQSPRGKATPAAMGDEELIACPECGEKDFEKMEETGSMMCMSCGHELSAEALEALNMYKGYKVGAVKAVSSMSGKLSLVEVDCGTGEAIPVVTNAKVANLAEGDLIVVATVGAVVPAGAAPDDPGAIRIEKSSVGGKARPRPARGDSRERRSPRAPRERGEGSSFDSGPFTVCCLAARRPDKGCAL